MTSVIVDLSPIVNVTDDSFEKLCQANPDIKFERNIKGKLVIVSPTGGETGSYNSEINADFVIWRRETKSGIVFDSSTCFRLPNGALRSPDVAWVRRDRWDALSPEDKQRFPPIAPDFVLELLSPSDSLPETQDKMQEYIDNGVKLGWLLNRRDRQVEIYRPGKAIEVLQDPTSLSGEDVLPGFVLNLQSIW